MVMAISSPMFCNPSCSDLFWKITISEQFREIVVPNFPLMKKFWEVKTKFGIIGSVTRLNHFLTAADIAENGDICYLLFTIKNCNILPVVRMLEKYFENCSWVNKGHDHVIWKKTHYFVFVIVQIDPNQLWAVCDPRFRGKVQVWMDEAALQ